MPYHLQSGGNAIPLGQRRTATAQPSHDNSNFTSDSDSDQPLPGEIDSDDPEDAELDNASDSSQLQLPADTYNESDVSDASDSDEDAPLAAEQQGAASRQNLIPSVLQPNTHSQRQLPLQASNSSDDGFDDDDDDDDNDQEEAAAHDAHRRQSHQVRNSYSLFCCGWDRLLHIEAV